MPFSSKAIRERARRRIAQQVRNGEPCTFCRRPIDLRLKYPHPEAFTVDHRVPTSLLPAGTADHPDQWRPAHNRCNRLRSNSPDGTVGLNSGALG
jgi:5-methylcytosine-specific restriction endonuclease McrA